MADAIVVLQRLYSSDLRMLACRREPDPRSAGCCKVTVRANGAAFFLCPARVERFLSATEGFSLAGVECQAVKA